jgi:50S ribosomal protein L16 3-hydroxylase
MLKLPGNLTAETFLKRYWQKQPLFMPGALNRVRPSITRNELGWLATLEDVESRLVFVERSNNRCRYRAETGPFEPEYLQDLPKRDWTLLVHDVEKHLPAMRALLQHVPFIPDWRIDDLMVSFAAPGGGVGPHQDNYDVFLCQGIGVRNWQFTIEDIIADPDASDELALLSEFTSEENVDTAEGDVLYLPPGAPHWGTAKRACMTYSIGMRAPQVSDFSSALIRSSSNEDDFYRDPDLDIGEALPGYISSTSAKRVSLLLGLSASRDDEVTEALGRFATDAKDWLKPEGASANETEGMLGTLQYGGCLKVHGMSQIAFDDRMLYVNGSSTALVNNAVALIKKICVDRALKQTLTDDADLTGMIRWMLQRGAFEIPENP